MGSTALVTGGTGGLGAAVTKRLLADGWRVVVPWREAAELDRVDEHERLELVQADLLDEESVGAVVTKAGKDLTAVVNLVGGYSENGRVHETPVQDFEAQLRLNLRPTYLVTAAALPALVAHDSSAIVCIGARAALRPYPGVVGYATSKAAILAFTDVLDAEYRADGVRANAILPSVIDTPANRAAMPDAEFADWVRPQEIAAMIAHLIGDEGRAVTGSRVKLYARA